MNKEMEGKWVIVRTYSAGVFFGKLKKLKVDRAILMHSIRLWKWAGAASLSQLAVEGVKKPEECKFAIPVEQIYLTGVIEIIPTTEKAEINIRGVKSWEI